MTGIVEHIAGHTFHGRKGAVANSFRYSIDYVLLDSEAKPRAPGLFSRNRGNLISVQDRDHGGAPKKGRGPVWAREVLQSHQIRAEGPLLLLTQPRVLGHVFNPVSFWLAHDGQGRLVAVIAEVTNTFGDRHSYLCAHPDGAPITREDHLTAQKVFHVSPFQPIAGNYVFRFDIGKDRIGIWIDLTHGNGGVIATLCGARKPLTNRAILWAMLRRPFGARRVLGLIFWQALRLKLKGAGYRDRPAPPEQTVSQSIKEARG